MTTEEKGRIIDIHGKKLYTEFYEIHQNQPTLVFLHDSLGCVTLWRDFPQKLAELTNCNVLIYDRLGYGKSEPMSTQRETDYMEQEADVLNELLAVLNINEVILFGHSDGGTIALLMASKYPDKIKAVIAEAAHIFVEEVTLKGIRDAEIAYKTTNLPERLAKYHGDKVDLIFKAWTEIWTSPRFINWNIEHFLKNITAPLLFIQGNADEYGTLDQVEKTITQVTGISEKFILQNTGHTPHKEKPEMVLEKAAVFINGLKF